MTIELTTDFVTDLPMPRGPPIVSKPCWQETSPMTTATTVLALLPVLTSTGRGSDIMIPMAIPSFGGMLIALVTLFVVPVLYAWREEIRVKRLQGGSNPQLTKTAM